MDIDPELMKRCVQAVKNELVDEDSSEAHDFVLMVLTSAPELRHTDFMDGMQHEEREEIIKGVRQRLGAILNSVIS